LTLFETACYKPEDRVPARSEAMAAKKTADKAKPAAKAAAPKAAAPKAGGDLATQFEHAAVRVKALKKAPDDETKLRLYSLYKQASEGDVSGSRPGFFDFVGGAKFDAWTKLKGTSKDEAMKKYIALVDKLAG
jgi:acyl-CoA-binding protein